VVLDCGAVDRELISSELFGHEPGAFTGATSQRQGVFEQAHRGTVFLDEIGELPLDLQPKLLRVLEGREVKRLGGNEVIPVDVRVVAATNRDLETMIAERQFREDLYYRLCQVKIELPTLDDRREDIPLLAHAFLERTGGVARRLAPEVVSYLSRGSYPGNLRQLRNLVERAALVARGPTIEMKDFLLLGEGSGSRRTPGPAAKDEDAERERIQAALHANDGNLSRTARALKVALNTLKARMQKLGIPRPGSSDDAD
jgi:DNA-binding NtrC family response regulator